MSAIEQLSDSDLLSLYTQKKSEPAMRTLVSRHHATLHARFRRELSNEADAYDLQQQLWLKVIKNLSNYKEEGKFSHYLSRIAGNLITDFRRSHGRQSDVIMRNDSVEGDSDTFDKALNTLPEGTTGDGESNRLANDGLVEYLVKVLIPALPIDQRAAWLLQHESEYWDYDNRLDWQHLADLNGLQEEEVWQHFETARDKLFTSTATDKPAQSLEDTENLIFLVWTQSQRLKKEQKFTWDYFANLLGVPVETMKTRYRAARLKLSEGLQEQMQ